MKKLIECFFFLPTRRDANLSDGELHQTDDLEWLDKQLFSLFEGGTLAPGLYRGSYRDPDTKQQVRDESYKYILAVPKTKIRQLRLLLAEACLVFAQKCIYLSVAGQVEFVRPKNHESG